jgi:hypothetical protein
MQYLRKTLITLSALLLILSANSCKKDETSNNPGSVKLRFDYVFGSSNLPWAINQNMRHPKTGDSLSFSTFNFYISNLKLQKTDGTWWAEPQSYHLICASCANPGTAVLSNVPAGNYQAIEFLLGIDSAAHFTANPIGALSPNNEMYWDNQKGYIMIKAEGVSPQSNTGSFALHIGGYQEPFQIRLDKKNDFKEATLTVSESSAPTLLYQANVARLWHSSPGVSEINTLNQSGDTAYTMAMNFYSSVVFLEAK